jgi:hypothetical protein
VSVPVQVQTCWYRCERANVGEGMLVWVSVPVLTTRLPHCRSCTPWPWSALQTSSSPLMTSRLWPTARTPYLAVLKSSGWYYMVDLHRVGSIPALLKYLLAHHGPH